MLYPASVLHNGYKAWSRKRTGVEVDAGCGGVSGEGQRLARVPRRASSGERDVLHRRVADGVERQQPRRVQQQHMELRHRLQAVAVHLRTDTQPMHAQSGSGSMQYRLDHGKHNGHTL